MLQHDSQQFFLQLLKSLFWLLTVHTPKHDLSTKTSSKIQTRHKLYVVALLLTSQILHHFIAFLLKYVYTWTTCRHTPSKSARANNESYTPQTHTISSKLSHSFPPFRMFWAVLCVRSASLMVAARSWYCSQHDNPLVFPSCNSSTNWARTGKKKDVYVQMYCTSTHKLRPHETYMVHSTLSMTQPWMTNRYYMWPHIECTCSTLSRNLRFL